MSNYPLMKVIVFDLDGTIIKDDKRKALTVAQTSSDRTLTISDGGSINLFMDNNHQSTNVSK